MVTKSTAAPVDRLGRLIELNTALAWRPEPGDRLTGVLAQVRKQDGGEFCPHPVFVFDTPNSVVAVHAFHQTLIDGLKDVNASKGQTYTIAYVGYRETNKSVKDGLSGTKDEVGYHLYVVIAGDGMDALPEGDYDWTADTES